MIKDQVQLHPEPTICSADHLEELVLWATRAKDADGLDHGYWQTWGPPCDVQELVNWECLKSFSTWVAKQLRTHRDATSQVGATLQKLQKSLFDEEMGKVDFASAIALLNELPQRLEAVEENTRTLVARVNKLNSDPLKRVSTRGSIAPVSGPREFEIHDKPGDQAVKECREAVNLMLEMQRNFKEQQEEAFVKRLASFDVAFQEAGLANAEEIAYRFHAQVRELEGIYARAAGLEEGLQNVEEHLAKSLQGIDDWKAAFSVRLDDLEGRIDQAEDQFKTQTGDMEALAQQLNKLAEENQGDRVTLTRSRGSHSKEEKDKKMSDLVIESIQEDMAKSQNAAQKAISMAEELEKVVGKMQQEMYTQSSSPNAWPLRNARPGRLPNLPPSSLAQEEEKDAPRYLITDDQAWEYLELPKHKAKEAKERFLPPSGGCFRHRARSRNKRPSTAQSWQVQVRGEAARSRPATAHAANAH
ncbi:unnamed protein product [Durusdinium trenchii]|uniref:Uncharacterized protein n=1 Tax=Durusdinium trenchii TaxID=1381693 RepID=A0ABP0RFS7_9DINO